MGCWWAWENGEDFGGFWRLYGGTEGTSRGPLKCCGILKGSWEGGKDVWWLLEDAIEIGMCGGSWRRTYRAVLFSWGRWEA